MVDDRHSSDPAPSAGAATDALAALAAGDALVGVGSPAVVLREVLSAVRAIATGTETEVDCAPLTDLTDSALIGMLGTCRELRSVLAAVEFRAQAVFDDSQRSAAEQRGVPKKDRGKGIADQIALARGVSAHRAANDLALATGLVRELPRTMSVLAMGMTTEHAALGVAAETACLMPEDRAVVDEKVAGRLNARTSRKRATGMARAEAAQVDADSVVARIRMAENTRCVTLRPAPDAMVYLSVLTTVRQGVAAFAALDRHATTLRATGDPRSRGAVMADHAIALLTGEADPDKIPVEIQLVMPAETLLGRGATNTPTHLNVPAQTGHPDLDGPAGATVVGETPGRIGEHVIPAEICREIALVRDDDAKRWIRRLFTDPTSGQVREVDERKRLFTGSLRQAITLRDQACRTCGGPLREVDHITPHASGGATSMINAQGQCQRCNLTKQLPGWSSTAFEIDGSHIVLTTTPTGHRYLNEAPPALPARHQPAAAPPTHDPPDRATNRVERLLEQQLDVIWPGAA